MHGSTHRARQHLDESLAVAERQGARFEHAQTLLARGRLGVILGWPQADDDVVNGRQALQSLGADFALNHIPASVAEKPTTLSLADRFDTVLDAGRRIASALSREAIFQAIQEAALQLLRGERCLILGLKMDVSLGGLAPAETRVTSHETHATRSREGTLTSIPALKSVPPYTCSRTLTQHLY